jgi:predicted MFS family arabinose efflux permease
MALTFLPEGRRSRREEEVGLPGYRRLAADRTLQVFLLASVLVAFVYFQVQATLPLQVVGLQGLTNADYGFLLALNGAMVVAFELPLSSITMRLRARHMNAASFALVGVGFGILAFADAMPLLLLSVVIWTTGEMIGVPVGHAYVAEMAPAHMRGRYQGLYGLALGSGGVLGPAIGTILFAANARAFWLLCGAVGLIGSLMVLAARPRRDPGTVVVPEAVPEAPRLEV